MAGKGVQRARQPLGILSEKTRIDKIGTYEIDGKNWNAKD